MGDGDRINERPTERGEGDRGTQDVQISVLGDRVDMMSTIHWEEEWV